MLISRRARLFERAWQRLTQRKQALSVGPRRIELHASTEWPSTVNVDFYSHFGVLEDASAIHTPYNLSTKPLLDHIGFGVWMPNATIDAIVRVSK